MKRFMKLLIVLTVLLSLSIVATVPAQAATVKLNKASVTLCVGDSISLKVLNTTSSATWSKSSTIVSLKKTASRTAKITAKRVGTCTVKAKVKGKYYSCKVKIVNPEISATEKTMCIGDSATIKLNDPPGEVTWKASSTVGISLLNSGSRTTVKAKAAGIYTVTATSKGKTYSCTIIVKKPYLNNTNITGYVGDVITLELIDNKQYVTWTTSNSSIATVSNGVVTLKNNGSCTISAKVGANSYNCSITVKRPNFSNESLSIEVGNMSVLSIYNYYGDVRWVSSNSAIATVTGSNSVASITGVNAGTCTITAVLANGTSISCNVTVANPTPYLVPTMSLTKGYYTTLFASKTVGTPTWSNSNPSVVSIEPMGSSAKITGLARGTSRITIHSGGKTATCIVTVN